ncbi:MAG: MFS transporter [Planctomycetes bacterium]|nr:MFS transporter [Planctomycetota bacterium]
MANDHSTDAATCPLGDREQVRNLVLVAVNTGLSYLASPVLYVGVVHASLCDWLQTSATVANLPATAYLIMSPLPLLVAWLFPYARYLKPVMVGCYASLATVNAMMAIVLLLPVPTEVKVAVLVLQGAIVGGARTVAVAFEFEVLGRAVSPARRGTALGLAYGAGPILAIIGALVSQWLLSGKLGPWLLPHLEGPYNFAMLFAAGVPIMALGSFLASRYVIPAEASEPPRPPFLQGVFGGFGKFLAQPVIRRAMIVAIIVLAGYTIISNMTLYTREVLGVAPAEVAGYQNTVRFACKAVTGLLLGWILARTNPRVGVLITAGLGLTSVLWALLAPGNWFLLSFGFMGAAELFGIYVTNYILCCSPRAEMRRYMAFTMVTLFPAAFAGVLFGFITDQFSGEGESLAAASAALARGFQASFLVACVFIGVGILNAVLLPARPNAAETQS